MTAIHSTTGDHRGEKNERAKLTELQVREIRQLYVSGDYEQRELAWKYRVDPSSISNVVTRRTWAHIGD